ncbi:MAG: hypothetical protein H8K08_04205 [Nitrospira sp.]|nr:hypothetical protein [Nitrospira sp.]
MSLEDTLYPLLKSYTQAPQWVKTCAGYAYTLIPKPLRYGAAHRTFHTDATCLPQHIPALTDRKLGETLHWAIRTVPAYSPYRSLLSGGLSPQEILSRLPLVSKETFKAQLPDYLSQGRSQRTRMEMFTGGSTAQPMRFFLERNITRMKEHAFVDEVFTRLGTGPKDIILVLRGRTVPTANTPGGRLWMYEPIKRQLILSCDHLEPHYMPEYLKTLREWRPRFIHAFPSALIPLARWLSQHPEPGLSADIRGILLTSENVYEHQLTLLRSVFSCPIITHYGHSERVLMATSLPNDSRYFFWPQYGYFELVDTDGKPITQSGAVGEIVGTSYDNRVMPFIRYRTGDFAVLSHTAHPDYPCYPVCERIEGRLQEFVVCADSRLVSITTLGAAHFDLLSGVEEIQYEQMRPGHVVLKILSARALSEEMQNDIRQAVLSKTQGGCTVTIQHVAQIPRTERGKHRMMIQHLDIRQFLATSTTDAA